MNESWHTLRTGLARLYEERESVANVAHMNEPWYTYE